MNKFFIFYLSVILLNLVGCGSPEAPVNHKSVETNSQTFDHRSAKEQIEALHRITCKSYVERKTRPIGHFYSLYVISERQKNRSSSNAINCPLVSYSDVLCALPIEPGKAIFMPNLNGEHGISYPADPQALQTVIRQVRLGFSGGYTMVGMLLATRGHQMMAAFKDSGEYFIIDSMASEKIEITSFTRALNQANILNRKGEIIQFRGHNKTTRLQKSGNDCIRLAALYLRQILKENDLNAYQKVNGAFLDGTLKKFEDIEKIDRARPIETVTPSIDRDRDGFMYSWDHRNHGLLHDNGWRGIKLSSLRSLQHGGREHYSVMETLASGEEQTLYDESAIWEPEGEELWHASISTEGCKDGIHLCRSMRRKLPLFATNFKNLTEFRQASSAHKISDMNLTLEQIFGHDERSKMLIYLTQSNEFFLIEKAR